MYDKSKVTIDIRITSFVKNVFKVVRSLQVNCYNKNIIDQLLKSSTSIGANYYEGSTAGSSRDFINKLNIAKKEAAESKYWLDLLSSIEPPFSSQLSLLSQESHEILLICGAIVRNTKIKIEQTKNTKLSN